MINPEFLVFYDKDMRWVVEPEDFTMMVGALSDKTDTIELKVTE